MVTRPSTPTLPRSTSVYEILRTHPAARARLAEMGVTAEFLDYRIGEAAHAVGIPLERLTAVVTSPE